MNNMSHYTTGLCGNFNDIMSDDFRGISGLVEGTAVAFANIWKAQSNCRDIGLSFTNPCDQNIEKGTITCHVPPDMYIRYTIHKL